MALDRSGETWKAEGYEEIPLGEHQTLTVRHLTRSTALRPLWREGFPFAGYNETLSPAKSNPVTWSASWRVVVDFSTSPPQAKGIYPGGQSGNPMSVNYDAHMQKYVGFEYYDLDLSASFEQ
jgi:penicillin amidase